MKLLVQRVGQCKNRNKICHNVRFSTIRNNITAKMALNKKGKLF